MEYNPGRQNTVADALSRRDTFDAHVSALSGPTFDLFEGLRQAAHTDPALMAFHEKLENGVGGTTPDRVKRLERYQDYG
jgi:hypothetical protein